MASPGSPRLGVTQKGQKINGKHYATYELAYNELCRQVKQRAVWAKHRVVKLTARVDVSTRGEPDCAHAAMERRRGWWVTMRQKYPRLAQAAKRLLAMHVTSAAAERNWSAWGRQFTAPRSGMKLSTGEMLIYIQANSGEDHEGVDHELVLTVVE